MKRPKWTDTTPAIVAYSELTLRRAAIALRIDAKFLAKFLGKNINRDAACALEKVANNLDAVAAGKTWAQAFYWPKIDDEKEGK
jgi:hypothetical protein